MVQKIYLKMYLVSCTNTHSDVTDSVNHGMVENTKTWISWEQNIIFLRNKRILNLCLRWHILITYRFLAEVTFKNTYFFRTHLVAASDTDNILKVLKVTHNDNWTMLIGLILEYWLLSLNIFRVLINFMPLVSFYIPWKQSKILRYHCPPRAFQKVISK